MATATKGGTTLGRPAPEVALPTIDGGTLRLQDLVGKGVLLFCWASW